MSAFRLLAHGGNVSNLGRIERLKPSMRTDTPQRIYLKDYRPPDYLVETVELDVALDARATRVRSTLTVRRNKAASVGKPPLVLDGEKLKLVSVSMNGVKLSKKAYTLGERSLSLAAVPNDRFTLEIETVCDPKSNTELSGLYLSNGTFCTQCEAEGFRRITFFLDRPDVLSVYTTRLTADRDRTPVLLANGNPIESGWLEGGRHFAIWHDPFPKPSYLFAMVGGNLGRGSDSFTTASGRKVGLNIYVEPGKEVHSAYAMAALKRAMRWDEERFGREYDLEQFNIVAVSDFNMGAMENKGLNIFNDKYILASPETATDADYANIEAIIAHEYFHNWTGNRITCRDWFQLCLKEGLTVFRDQEFSADMRQATVERIGDVRLLRSQQFAEDAGPLAHPVRPESFLEINNFYTPTVYEKGADLVRMIRTIVGPEGFRAGMDLYFVRHDGEAATVENFIRCFEDAAAVDLNQFRLWYSQAGTPELVVKGRYSAAKRTFTLEVEQIVPATPGQPHKKPMHIPLTLGLVGSRGVDLPLKLNGTAVADGILHVRKRKETFRFDDVSERPVPSLLRGFSAPVQLTTNTGEKDLLFLLAHDSDAFNRWQAAYGCAIRRLAASYAALRDGSDREENRDIHPFAEALGRVVTDETLEAAYRAQLLELPGESDLAMALGADVDPDAVHVAREAMRGALARLLAPQLESLYEAFKPNAPYSPDAESAGRRALRNAALALLAAPADAAAAERVAAHYEAADNMTDMMAALGIITHIDHAERARLLDDFRRRFKGDALVLDKWYCLEAASTLPGTIERVVELSRDKAFSPYNPNRVRALLGTFATANQTGFHRADGAGYRLIGSHAVDLDHINPQLAARLLGAFKNWKIMEPLRRKTAEAALRQVAETEGLSADVIEIAQRSLD